MYKKEITENESKFIREVLRRSNLIGIITFVIVNTALCAWGIAGYINAPVVFPVILILFIVPLELLVIYIFKNSFKTLKNSEIIEIEGEVHFFGYLSIGDKRVSLPAHWEWFYSSNQRIKAKAVYLPDGMIFSSILTTALKNSNFLVLTLIDENGYELNIEDDVKNGFLRLVNKDFFFIASFISFSFIPVAFLFYKTFNQNDLYTGPINIYIISLIIIFFLYSFYKVVYGIRYNRDIKKSLNYGNNVIKIRI